MFSKSAQYYDQIYASIDKDYEAEAKKAHRFIQKYQNRKSLKTTFARLAMKGLLQELHYE